VSGKSPVATAPQDAGRDTATPRHRDTATAAIADLIEMSSRALAAASLSLLGTPCTLIAGTTLHPAGDVFDRPPAAVAAPSACRTAEAYIDFINAGQYRIGALFAADAVFLTPIGQVATLPPRWPHDPFFRP
jgi:hypothetical protein